MKVSYAVRTSDDRYNHVPTYAAAQEYRDDGEEVWIVVDDVPRASLPDTFNRFVHEDVGHIHTSVIEGVERSDFRPGTYPYLFLDFELEEIMLDDGEEFRVIYQGGSHAPA